MFLRHPAVPAGLPVGRFVAMESTTNWERLAHEVKRRRTALGLTQRDVAVAARISLGSVKNLESGKGFERQPASLPGVEEALSWSPGSAKVVLRGGHPTLLAGQPDGPPAPVGGRSSPLEDRLPERVVQALESGRVVDADVYESGGAVAVTVVLRDPHSPRSAEAAEQLRRTMLEWTRSQLNATTGQPRES